MQNAKMTASAPREIHPCVYSKSTKAGGNRSVLDLAIVLGEPVVLGVILYWCGVDGRRAGRRVGKKWGVTQTVVFICWLFYPPFSYNIYIQVSSLLSWARNLNKSTI